MVGNPTSALGLSGSSFGPSSLAPIGIHHLLLSNLTTGYQTHVQREGERERERERRGSGSIHTVY